MEKRRGADFESKVERKWRRRRRRRLGSNARFVVRRRNSDRRLPALRQFMDAPFSLSFVLGTAHPAQCSEKAKPTREDSGVTLYSVVVTDASKEIFFLSLFLSPHENEQAFLSSWSYSMSAYVVHHIFSLYRVRRCSTYLYIYITFRQFSSLLPLNVECSSNDSARQWKYVSSRIWISRYIRRWVYSEVKEISKKRSKSE